MENQSNDPLLRYPFYVKALEFYDRVIDDQTNPLQTSVGESLSNKAFDLLIQ